MMSYQNNIPQLRFQEFEGEFKQTKFGKLYSFQTTNSLSRDKLNYEGGNVYNIHYGDIHTKFKSHFYLSNENVPYINKEVDLSKIKDELYCKNGDIIIADASEDYADIGKSIELIDIDNVKLLAGLHTLLARPISDKIFVGFTSYLLKSWPLRKQIMTIAQGSKVLSLSTGRVSNLELNIPTLPEQQKIASFLSAVDEKIQQLSRKKELLEQYKKGVMQQLFSGKLRFKDENGNDYADWEEKKLGEVAKYYDGTHQTPNYVETGIPFYSVEHVTANQFTKSKYISEEVFEKENKRVKLEKGDILMTRIGDIGTSRLIDWDVKASFYVSLALIKQNEKYNSTFLNQYISSVNFQKELWANTIHVAFPKKINLGEIGKCKIKFPSLPEQQKISAFLSSIDLKIESTNQQITKTQSFKKGLLQQLFV